MPRYKPTYILMEWMHDILRIYQELDIYDILILSKICRGKTKYDSLEPIFVKELKLSKRSVQRRIKGLANLNLLSREDYFSSEKLLSISTELKERD